MSDTSTVAIVIAAAGALALILWFVLIRRGKDSAGTAVAPPAAQPHVAPLAATPAAPPTPQPVAATAAAAVAVADPPAPVQVAEAAPVAASSDADTAPTEPEAPVAPVVNTIASTGALEITAIHHGGLEHDPGEWVVVANNTAGPVQLEGWRLSDEGAKHLYAFPELVLEPGATLRVHMWNGEDSATDLYVGFRHHWWNNTGDTAYLYDGSGTLIHSHSYEALATDE